MKFRVSHEVLFVTEIEAANEKEAGAIADQLPYEEWERSTVMREDVVPIEESPVNPFPSG